MNATRSESLRHADHLRPADFLKSGDDRSSRASVIALAEGQSAASEQPALFERSLARRALVLAGSALVSVALIRVAGQELLPLSGHAIDLASAGLALVTGAAGFAVLRTTARPAPVVARPVAPVATGDAAMLARLARLEHERDAAAAASAAKSRYLANVSHEIRAPLNAIYGYAQLVERGSGVDPTEAARVIRRSAEHLTDLVEGLLDISLVEHGVMRVAADVVRLGSFLDQIERMFRPAASAKGLDFRLDVRGRLPESVRTDQKRLRQVLINLVSNAIKFTQSGSVTLAVAHSGQVATFEVRDTGPGISDAARQTIFAPFERGEQDARSEGFGLGLPITRAIVQILGGELDLDSTPGQGSCFRVRLLLAEVAATRDTGDVAQRAQAPIIGYEGARRTILVMDDDVRQLAFVRQALEDIGFDVATAPDGATALALADARRFDLALLDIAMEGPDGWHTAASLRQRHGKGLRIVMLSANAHERHGPPSGDAPHDLFLVKPVEIGALFDALGDQLKLVWLRAGIAAIGPIPDDAADHSGPEMVLSAEARAHLAKLRDLLKIGYARGIEAEIRAFEAAAPPGHALVATLYDCLDRFDLAGLSRTIEGY